MKKRIFSLILAIAMVAGLLPTMVFAAEENTTLAIGDNEIRAGNTYTYTAEQDGTLYVTVMKLYYGGAVVPSGWFNSWVTITINDAAITEFANTVEVSAGDTVTVAVESLDADTCHGTVNLGWNAPVFAEITGVSITVDGKTYTEGEVIITPTSTIKFTVSGTNFANVSHDNWLIYASGLGASLTGTVWNIDTAANTATLDCSAQHEFKNCDHFEVMYSNDGGNSVKNTGIYLTYDDSAGGEEDESVVTVYFDNTTAAWSTVRAYYWGGSNSNVSWPGTAMTKVEGEENIYFLEIPADAINIIFNNGSNQTSDLTIPTDGNNMYNYTTDEWTTYVPGGSGGEEDSQTLYIDVTNMIESGKTFSKVYLYVYDSSNKTLVNEVDMIFVSGNIYSYTITNYGVAHTASVSIPYDGGGHLDWNFRIDQSGLNLYTPTADKQGSWSTYVPGEGDGDDTTGSEEDTSTAEITGVSITVDGTEYTSGQTATITPDSTVEFTVTGTNLDKLDDNAYIFYAWGTAVTIGTSEPGATQITVSVPASNFSVLNAAFEIRYAYDAYSNTIGTGLYVQYDNLGADAEITGVRLRVDGTDYISGTAVIKPDSSVTITLLGQNLNNVSSNYDLNAELSLALTNDLWVDNEDRTERSATYSGNIFSAFTSKTEIMYTNDKSDIDNYIGSGVYVIYGDGTGGEEDTSTAEITGVSITVDGTEYTSGQTATITPDSTVEFTVTGTNLDKLDDNAYIFYAWGTAVTFGTSEPGATQITVSVPASDFIVLNAAFEIYYAYDLSSDMFGTGLYVQYDNLGADAEITGVRLRVDGTDYISGTAVIKPDSSVTITLLGQNLNNVSSNYGLNSELALDLTIDSWVDNEDRTERSATYSGNIFSAFTSETEILYTNDTNDVNNYIGSGVYVIYDDGTTEPEESSALVIGDNEINDGNTYTYTAEQDGTLYVTVTKLYYGVSGVVNATRLNNWVAVSINGTAITKFANTVEVSSGDTVTVAMESLDGDSYHGTINLSWDVPVFAEITGVSITVDGVTYTEGNVTIKPDSTVVYTVYGRNLANVSADSYLWYSHGFGAALTSGMWTIDAATNTATWDASEDIDLFERCDNFLVEYSNDGQQSWTGTGIYLTYNAGTTEPAVITGVSITVDGVTYTEGNVTITPTSTIVYTVYGTNFANLSKDNCLSPSPSIGLTLSDGNWTINAAGNMATRDFSARISLFDYCDNFEVAYSNDGNALRTGTGIYLTFVKPVLDSTGKIVVDMRDDYGDGWNDAAIEIYKNGSLEATATVDTTFNTVSLDYDSTASYEFKWVMGSYDSECSFTIYVDGEAKLEVYDASALENGEIILTLRGSTTEPEQPVKNGLQKGEDGNFYYYIDDAIQEDYTGFVDNSAGSWYILNGQVQLNTTSLVTVGEDQYFIKYGCLVKTTGLAKVNGQWSYFTEGKLNADYTGLVEHNGLLVYVVNGHVDFNGKDIVEYEGKLYYVKSGIVSPGFTGMAKGSDEVWRYIEAGTFDETYTGLAKNAVGWWYVENGLIDTTFTGLVTYGGADYYVKWGQVMLSTTGIVEVDGESCYIKGGIFQSSYKGLITVDTGTWYLVDGKVDVTFNSEVDANGVIYTVVNGYATAN